MGLSNVFFTSDTHFGHANIMRFNPQTRYRGVAKTVDEMDELMINAWNEVVPTNGVVYHLGDVSFHKRSNTARASEILNRLNGTIHLIYGNHDSIIRETTALSQRFASAQEYLELKFVDQKIVLCHFPFAVWNRGHHGSWNLYGHCHGSFQAVGRQADVGWDTRDFQFGDGPRGPVSLEQVARVLSNRDLVVQDHHRPENQD